MKRGPRWLGVLAESVIVLVAFTAAVLLRFSGFEGLLEYPRLVPKALRI